jgi:hypothetical protein
LQGPGRELAGQPIEPLVDVIRAQLRELDRADFRDDVLLGQAAQGLNRLVRPALETLGQPVRHGVGDRVIRAGLDPRFQVVDYLLQLVFDGFLRPALALDALAAPTPIKTETDRTRVTVLLGVDRGLVLPD